MKKGGTCCTYPVILCSQQLIPALNILSYLLVQCAVYSGPYSLISVNAVYSVQCSVFHILSSLLVQCRVFSVPHAEHDTCVTLLLLEVYSRLPTTRHLENVDCRIMSSVKVERERDRETDLGWAGVTATATSLPMMPRPHSVLHSQTTSPTTHSISPGRQKNNLSPTLTPPNAPLCPRGAHPQRATRGTKIALYPSVFLQGTTWRGQTTSETPARSHSSPPLPLHTSTANYCPD